MIKIPKHAHSTDKTNEVVRLPSIKDLVNEFSPFVWRSMRFFGIPEADIPDQGQEVFMVVHRRGDSFEERSTVRSWIYGICRRVALAYRRRAHVRHESVATAVPEGSMPADQDTRLEFNDNVATLDLALAGLAEETRAVFVLFEVEEMPMKEVAEAMACPLQTAYSRLHAAREHVRDHFRRAERRETSLSQRKGA